MLKVNVLLLFVLYYTDRIVEKDLYTHLLIVILISLFVGYIIGKRDN